MSDDFLNLDEDANYTPEKLQNEEKEYTWDIQNWSDESSEFYKQYTFSGCNFQFSIQRDNSQQFDIYLCGYNNEHEVERFQIKIILMHPDNEHNISKSIEVKITNITEDSIKIHLPIKQDEVEKRGFVLDDQIHIQISIKIANDPPEVNIFENLDFKLFSNDSYEDYTKPIFSLPTFSKIESNVKFVGLKNQGATCYMNSLLQALFHLPCFRRIVFEMEEKSDVPTSSNIVHNLKLLFAQMQFQMNQPISVIRKSVSTTTLTKSFGWTFENTFMQHDVQEFCRVLLGNLEDKMKGTKNEESIKQIFSGEYQTYTKGINIEFENTVNNEFYDLSLEVKDCSDIYQSFDKYVEEQILNGDNQYNSEKFGKQDALMGIKFIKFPRVLYLHLKRFEIDQANNRSIKINSPFKFYKTINLSNYLIQNSEGDKKVEVIEVSESDDEISKNKNDGGIEYSLFSNQNDSNSAEFELFGVLVHSGSSLSGHFYAFLRPNLDGEWYQFNDSLVRESSEEEAIESNFGRDDRCFSAYMLIYIKKSEQKELFRTVEDDSIPPEIVEAYFELLEKEKEDEIQSQKQKQSQKESSDVVNIYLYNEKTTLIRNSKKNKLSFDFNKDQSLSFSMSKSDTYGDLYSKISELYSLPVGSIDLWKFNSSGFDYNIRNDNDPLSQLFYSSIDVFVFTDNKKIQESQDSQKVQKSDENEITFDSNIFNQDIDDDNSYNFPSEENDIFSFLNQTEIPIFIFAYCPFNSPVFTYLTSLKVDRKNSIVDSINSELNSIFRIESDADHKFNTYYLDNDRLKKVKSKDDTFFETNCQKGGIFVVELSDDEKDSEFFINLIQMAMERNGYDDTNDSKEKVANLESNDDVIEMSFLDDKEEDSGSQQVVNFLEIMSIENLNASEYFSFSNNFNLIEVCSVIEKKRIKYPNSIQFGEFCQFLCAVFNTSSVVILFKENQTRMIIADENEVMSYIISPHDKKINAMFLDSSSVNNKNEIEIRDVFVPFENVLKLNVDVSLDAISKVMSTEILVPDNFLFSDVYKLIKERGLIENFEEQNSRILEIRKRRIHIVLNMDDQVLNCSGQIRIEKIPGNQIEIEFGDFIKVAFSKEIKHDPFLLLVKYDFETIADIKDQIRILVNESEVEFSSFKVKFCSENGNEIKELIKNQTKINEIDQRIDEILFSKQPKMHSIFENTDRSVQIYN